MRPKSSEVHLTVQTMWGKYIAKLLEVYLKDRHRCANYKLIWLILQWIVFSPDVI